MYHANTKQQEDGGAVLISDKVDFRAKNVTMSQKVYFIVIKPSFHHKNKKKKSYLFMPQIAEFQIT